MRETADLEDEIQMLRRERERLGMQLLELQQRVASVSLEQLQQTERQCDIVEDELRGRIRELESENAAMRGTFTWRVSGPARRLRQRFRAS
jgi:predicted  nucleic acid-binding Zn-ribbon protein